VDETDMGKGVSSSAYADVHNLEFIRCKNWWYCTDEPFFSLLMPTGLSDAIL